MSVLSLFGDPVRKSHAGSGLLHVTAVLVLTGGYGMATLQFLLFT